MPDRYRFDENEVDGLLETGGGLLAEISEGLTVPLDAERWLGMRFGDFELTRFLDRGGMSLVFRGERRGSDFQQVAAVKLLRSTASAELAARFARERQILASLDHPGIARIIDGGIEQGQPFLTMELVDGVAIDRHCDAQKLDLRARVRLCLQVCHAVQYAHSRLVVHRDIKPGNILVDRQGHVKLLDFGIAGLMAGDGPDITGDSPLLTPRYARPEQVMGRPISVASDVYQLGLLLHLLLSGCHAQPIDKANIDEIRRAIVDRDPPTPSQALVHTGETDHGQAERIANARRSGLHRLTRRLRGDLDVMVSTCLAKEPAHRYESVVALINDLVAWLAYRPIAARAPSATYRLHRFARRHWGKVTTGALFALGLLIAGAMTGLSWHQTRKAWQVAALEAKTATAVSDFLAGLLENADPRRSAGEQLTVRELLDQGAANLEQLADQAPVQIKLLNTMARAYFGLGRYEEAEQAAQRGIRIQDQAGEFDPAERIQLLQSISSAQVGLGRVDEAVQAAEQAVALTADMTLEQPVDLARALHALAVALFDSNRLVEAIELERHALDLLGDSPDTVRARMVVLTTIGSAARKQGDPAMAMTYYEQALALADSDPSHRFQRGFILRGMAQTRFDSGQPHPARLLAEQALTNDTEVFGAQSDRRLRSLSVLCRFLLELGDMPAAHQYFQQLEQLTSTIGPQHPNFGAARYYLALYQHRTGRLAEAEQSIEDAVNSRRNVYGNDDLPALDYSLSGVQFQLDEGRLQAARKGLEEVDNALSPAVPPDHPVIARLALLRARLAALSGRYQEAQSALSRLIVQANIDNPRQSLDYHFEMGRSLQLAGQTAAAVTALSRALAAAEQLFGPNSAPTLPFAAKLAAAKASLGHADAANSALASSVLARQLAGEGDIWAAAILADNAAVLVYVGEAVQARQDCDLATSLLTELVAAAPALKAAYESCETIQPD